MKIQVILLAILLSGSFLHAQTWTWSSENPQVGSDLVVTVKDLNVEGDIHIVGFYFQGKDLVTSDINYIVENGNIKMTLKVPETNWLRLVIKDEDNQSIAGEHRDIAWAGTPAKSSLVDYANATAAYYRVMGLQREEKDVAGMYREAIAADPLWLSNPQVLRSYYNMSKAAAAEDNLAQIQTHITTCEAESNAVSQELLINAIRIAKDRGDTTLHKSLRRKLDQSYPQSIVNQEDQLTLFKIASTLADRIIIRDQFKKSYAIDDLNRGLYDQMTSTLVQECAEKEDYTKMADYIGEIIDPSTKANICNRYAWTLSGEGLDNPAPQLTLAANLSSTSLMLMDPNIKKPSSMSQLEWEKSLGLSKAMYGDTYALILYKQGKYDEALEQQSSVVTTFDYQDLETNERYGIYLDKAGKKEELMAFTEDMIKLGKATPKMKEMHEEIWTNQKTHEQLYDQYIMHLESVAKTKRQEEIKGMWMEKPSIPFTLKGLDGKSVSLSDYKGKTVVLDFWATWCGPCKASFPGMKNAVEHYAANKNVVFLFIDTWENGENIPDKVGKFISENNYPFHVLMDSDNAVVTNYKVDGIPTKYIIGPDQKIRFKSVGFEGNNDVLVEELISMIEMTQEKGKVVTP